MKNIIAIQGKKGVGKDESAKYIRYILGTPLFMHSFWIAKLLNFNPVYNKWKIVRYADALKSMLAILLNVDKSNFEDRTFKELYYFDFNSYKLYSSIDVPNNALIDDKSFSRKLKANNLDVALNYILSIRQILQFFGTNIIRKFFGDKLWINNTLNIPDNNIIIADQRFIVENKSLRNSNNSNFVIHITRPKYSGGYHPSEKELDTLLEEHLYDVLLENDGSLKDLFEKCKNIVYANMY